MGGQPPHQAVTYTPGRANLKDFHVMPLSVFGSGRCDKPVSRFNSYLAITTKVNYNGYYGIRQSRREGLADVENSTAITGRAVGRPRGFDSAVALDAALDLFWQRGYESTSISDLCAAMSIKPPSLYAAFGNKAQLFLEAVNRYERTYWDPIWSALREEPDVHMAFANLFSTGARTMSSEDGRQGCLVTLSAVAMSPASADVARVLDEVRAEGIRHIRDRLQAGVSEHQIPAGVDIDALADALNAVLDGIALRARDGIGTERLQAMGRQGERMIPRLTS